MADDWFTAVNEGPKPQAADKSTDRNCQDAANDQGDVINEYIANLNAAEFPTVVALLKENAVPIETKGERGLTALHKAVEEYFFGVVKNLIENLNFPVNMQDDLGRTAFFIACERDNLPIMRLLLDLGADIEARDPKGRTPLLAAVDNGSNNAALIIMGRGGDLHARDNQGWSIAHFAAYKNNITIIRALKHFSFDWNTVDAEKSKPIHRALSSNALTCIQFFIDEGMEIDEETLKLARLNKIYPAQQLLENQGEKVNWFYKSFKWIFMAYMLLMYVVYVTYLVPNTAEYLMISLSYNIIAFTSVILFFMAGRSQPTILPASGEDFVETILPKMNSLFDDENWGEILTKPMCMTCLTQRPIRSKHCRRTNKWVEHMDHYCDFLGVWISKNNRKMFVALLLTVWLTSALFILLTVCSCTNTLEPGDSWSAFFVKILYEFIFGPTLLVIQGVLSAAVAWYGFWYAFLELYAISDALTVNEVMNRHRYRYLFTPFRSMDGSIQLLYRNPFTKGFAKNWLEFIAS